MKYFLSLIFLAFIVVTNSQVNINAQILNKETLEPVEFASVLVIDIYEGTISDTAGYFNLNVTNEAGKVLIQSLGFLSDTFLVKTLLDESIIYLEPSDFEIETVVVYPQNAFEIVQKAVEKISENYDAATIAQNVYYKQSIVANNQILSLQEANFDALSKFKNKSTNIVSIKKARAYMDVDTLKSLGKMVANQLEQFDSTDIKENTSQYFAMNFMLSDEIGDNNKSIFGQKGYKNYKYNYNGMVEKDGHFAYHITFDQLDEVKKSLFKGHLYIDTASFAFFDANFYLSPKGIQYQKVIPKTLTFLAKILGYTIYIKGLNYSVHYQQVDNKWVLDKTDSKLAAKVSKRNGPSFDGYLKMQFVVNEFYLKEGFYNKKSKYDILKSNIEDFQNTNFWEGLIHQKLDKEELDLINSLP